MVNARLELFKEEPVDDDPEATKAAGNAAVPQKVQGTKSVAAVSARQQHLAPEFYTHASDRRFEHGREQAKPAIAA